MIFREHTLPGVVQVTIEPNRDERGFFARSWCQKEFESHGLDTETGAMQHLVQHAKGNAARHALSGAPYARGQVGALHPGAIYDVVVDLRPESPTFKKWIAVGSDAPKTATCFIFRRVARTAF